MITSMKARVNDMVNLYSGDCLELMKDISSGSVDLILTDPPYGITNCRWDTIIPFDPMWEQLKRIIKPNGAICLFGGEPFSSALRMSNIKNFKYDWYWQKPTPTGFLNAKKQPLRNIETISVFYSKQPIYNPQKTHGHKRKVSLAKHKQNCKKAEEYNDYDLASYDSTERYPTQILRFKTDRQKSALHPTQKPVDLLEYLIRTYTNEGETVLDFTMGSGSTGVACVNTGRNFIGIELDEGYFQIAKQRIENCNK